MSPFIDVEDEVRAAVASCADIRFTWDESNLLKAVGFVSSVNLQACATGCLIDTILRQKCRVVTEQPVMPLDNH